LARALYIITPNGHQGNNFINSTQQSRRGQFLTNLFLPPWHLAGTHNLKMGADVDRLDYAQGISRTGYDLYGVNSDLLRSVTFEGNGTLSRPSLTASSYLTDHWQARRNLFFELGVREDWDEILRRWSWSPRASFSYAPFGSPTRASRAAMRCSTIPPSSSFSPGRSTSTRSPTLRPERNAAAAQRAVVLHASQRASEGAALPELERWVDHQFPWRIKAGLSLHRKRGGDGFAYVNTLPAPVVAPRRLPPSTTRRTWSSNSPSPMRGTISMTPRR
jgi:hypothetical protein